MRIVDFHSHIFPDSIAEKASFSIGDFYQMPMRFDGTVSRLLELGNQCGIDASIVHSVATVSHQVEAINDFIAQTAMSHPGRLVGFATLHPGYAHIEREVDRIISLGLRGIKIHPDIQKFNIDCKEAFRIYEAIEGRLPILVHNGDFRFEYSKARRMASVIERFPRLEVICAHFGGWSEWEESASILAAYNVKVDTSSSLYALTPEQARVLIDKYGVDNVLFGTDYPMWGPEKELEYISRINLADEEREKIMHGNADRLLGLSY